MGILLYPYFLIVFWYREFLPSAVSRSFQILVYTFDMLSVGLLLSTFFRPLKDEYREGLVLFSVIAGIFVKSIILAADILVILMVLAILIAINLIILTLPLLIIVLSI